MSRSTAPQDLIFDVPRLNRFGARLLSKRRGLMVKLAEMETGFLQGQIDPASVRDPIFVCGLARSGTTILLELLAQHGETASQRYLDFPFVFTPYVWNRYLGFARQGPEELAERSHKDGLMVSAESPEAMEEPLWMHFFQQSHDATTDNRLGDEDDHPAFEAFYRAHMAKLLQVRGRSRYLAKGNYHIARLPYLLKLFPEARFVIPVRDPVRHIASSEKQHALFTLGQKQNPDARTYLAQVGHFEFGLDRRAINVGDPRTAEVETLWAEGRETEGWALYWAMIHDYLASLLETNPALCSRVRVISYEAFCKDAEGQTRALADFCQLCDDDAMADFARDRIKAQDYYKPSYSPEEDAMIRTLTGPAHARIARFFVG